MNHERRYGIRCVLETLPEPTVPEADGGRYADAVLVGLIHRDSDASRVVWISKESDPPSEFALDEIVCAAISLLQGVAHAMGPEAKAKFAELQTQLYADWQARDLDTELGAEAV